MYPLFPLKFLHVSPLSQYETFRSVRKISVVLLGFVVFYFGLVEHCSFIIVVLACRPFAFFSLFHINNIHIKYVNVIT